MAIPTEVWPVLGTAIAALLTWLGVRTKVRGDKAVADKPDWNAFTDKIQKWTDQRLAERDEKIDRLETDVQDMRDEASRVRRKYNASVDFIRPVVKNTPELRSDVPPEIADDL